MKKSKLLLLSLISSFMMAKGEEYQLVVTIKNPDEKNKLQNLGFKRCQQIKPNVLVCQKSENLNYLLQLKDFLIKNGITAKVSQAISYKEEVKPKQTQEKDMVKQEGYKQEAKSQQPQEKNVAKPTENKEFNKRKPKEEIVKLKVEKKQNQTSLLDEYLKDMYLYLNSQDYDEAFKLAKKLENTKYRYDAKFVLGLINLKKENFKDACYIFEEIKNVKKEAKNLAVDSCWVYYMQSGYDALESGNLKKAYENFEKSLSYKENIESNLGIFYVYLKQRNFEKANQLIEKLYKSYPENKKIIQAYIDFLIETKQFDKLTKFQDYLTPQQKNLLQQQEIYSTLENVKKYIENKEFDLAEEKLKTLYIKNPNNIYVILNLGYLYLEKGEIDKAENYYKNALIIDPNNKDALKGLKAVYVKLGKYEEALEIVEKLKSMGVTDKDENKIKELFFLSKAQEYLKKGNLDLAEKYALEVLEINKSNPTAYLILSNIYKDKDKEKYLKYISQAYQLDSENIGIKIAYMYALINLNLFDQAKTILSTINPKSLTLEEKEDLKAFYRVFYEKLASFYLNNKNYQKAKKVALEGLDLFPNNTTLLEVLGWSCYNLKDYVCSEKTFNQLYTFDPKNENAKLGLAYNYLNLKKLDKLEPLLKDLEKSINPKILEEVATIYYSLSRYKDAEKVLEKYKSLSQKTVAEETEKTQETEIVKPVDVKPKKEREIPFILDENKEILNYNNPKTDETTEIRQQTSYSEDEGKTTQDYKKKEPIEELKEKIKIAKQDYTDNIILGVKLRDKSGENGKSKLTDISPFIKGTYYLNENLSFYIGGYLTSLNSGKLSDYANYGTPQNQTILREVPSSYSGIEPFGGFNFKSYKLDVSGYLGTTPKVDNGISSKLVYSLEGKIKTAFQKFGIEIYQKPMRDSILSYVGSKDPYSYNSWGRAVESGVKVSYEQSIGEKDSMVYSQISVGRIKGEQIQENTNINLIVMPKIYAGKLIGDEDYLGMFLLYNKFSKNQDCYYYGCGGYFSPKSMFIIAPMLEGFYFMNERFGLHYKAFLGALLLDNNDKKSVDVSFDGYIGGIYMLSKNMFFNVSGEYRKTSKYSEIFSSAYLQYFFGDRFNVNKNDLIKLEKEIYKP